MKHLKILQEFEGYILSLQFHLCSSASSVPLQLLGILPHGFAIAWHGTGSSFELKPGLTLLRQCCDSGQPPDLTMPTKQDDTEKYLRLTTVQFVLQIIQHYQYLYSFYLIHLLIDQLGCKEFWISREGFRPNWNMLSNLHVMVRSQTQFHGNDCKVLQGNLIYVDMHSNFVVWTEMIFIGPGKPARDGQLNACPSKNNKRRTQGLGTCILILFVKHMHSKHF